jgi:hypothetical protein
LGLILQPLLESFQPIVSMDAVPLHLQPSVLAEFHNVSLWYLVIPAGFTWLFQTLDTHAFGPYKRTLRELYLDGLCRPCMESVCATMMRYTIRTIRVVLQGRPWLPAFQQNGLCDYQRHVSLFVQHCLEYDRIPEVSRSPPTLAMLTLCWPSNRKPMAEMLAATLPFASPAHGLAALADAAVHEAICWSSGAALCDDPPASVVVHAAAAISGSECGAVILLSRLFVA